MDSVRRGKVVVAVCSGNGTVRDEVPDLLQRALTNQWSGSKISAVSLVVPKTQWAIHASFAAAKAMPNVPRTAVVWPVDREVDDIFWSHLLEEAAHPQMVVILVDAMRANALVQYFVKNKEIPAQSLPVGALLRMKRRPDRTNWEVLRPKEEDPMQLFLFAYDEGEVFANKGEDHSRAEESFDVFVETTQDHWGNALGPNVSRFVVAPDSTPGHIMGVHAYKKLLTMRDVVFDFCAPRWESNLHADDCHQLMCDVARMCNPINNSLVLLIVGDVWRIGTLYRALRQRAQCRLSADTLNERRAFWGTFSEDMRVIDGGFVDLHRP